MGRGRPKSVVRDPEDEPRKFTKEFSNSDGTKSIWYWDLDLNTHGAVSIEQVYPKNYQTPLEIQAKNNKHLPRRLQTFINPITCKTVGYSRALSLGITDKDNERYLE